MNSVTARRAIVTTGLLLPASCWPLRVLAQAATKPKQVAIVYNNVPLADLAGPGRSDRDARAFVSAMRELGWIEGRNVTISFFSAEGRFDRLPALLSRVAKSGADVIVAYGRAAFEARSATDTVPILALLPDVDSSALVGSPHRPGNVTAITTDVGPLMPKRLELLRAIAPRVSRVAILTSEGRGAAEAVEVEASARTLGVTLAWIKVEEVARMDAGLARALDEKADAILVDDTQANFAQRRVIAEFALQHRLPTVSAYQEFADVGGLMAYDANPDESVRLMVTYVDKILKGTKPADLPVVRPTVFDLAVNARTVRALGLAIPQSLQLRITRTIE